MVEEKATITTLSDLLQKLDELGAITVINCDDHVEICFHKNSWGDKLIGTEDIRFYTGIDGNDPVEAEFYIGTCTNKVDIYL